MISKLAKALESASIERQVEDAYNEALKKAFPDTRIEYPFACDGYCEFDVGGSKHKLLIEYKYDEDMSSKAVRSKVLVQVLAYMKKFEENGKPLPSVILVADKNECFVLHANDLVKWLDFEGAKWDGAPSGMASANPDLVLALAEDDTRNAFVFDVNDAFDFDAVVQKIKDMATNTVRKVRITEHNVDKVFKLFSEKIILEKKVSPNDMVALFFAVVTGSEDVYLHPAKKNCIVYNSKNLKCDSSKFRAFCSHFSTTCSPKEKARLAAISDRLIEDTKRRKDGAFFTPTEWTDEAHRRITQVFGDNWRDEYVVWDPAAGTLNLERDYNFKELYASTLEQSELDIAKNYNTNSLKFAFDFLNGSDEELFAKAPGLKTAFEQNKKIIVLFNPPYKTASSSVFNNVGQGTTENLVNKEMQSNGMKLCSRESYAQFLYRIMTLKEKFSLTNINLAFFCKPKFICGESFKPFRDKFLKAFKYEDGMFFNAGHFSNVSANWGITFNIWTSGETQDKLNFKHDLVDTNANGEIVVVGSKILYNNDNSINAFNWTLNGIKQKRTVVCPNFRHTDYTNDPNGKVKQTADSIGCMYCSLNNIGMSTITYYHTPEWSIERHNFEKWAALFSAINIPEKSWITEKDETFAPNEQHPKFNEFIADSIVFMAFGGYDVSLRNVIHKNTSYDIKNEFFWLNKKFMEDLANKNGNDECYNQAHADVERFVYSKLQNIILSKEAKDVIDAATNIVVKSFKYRKLYNDEHPEAQINNWDCGWCQISRMCKEYLNEELKEFKELYKKLADKMRPMVYELGFLRK